jgi:predicted nuclease of predicted toxin-antitoxin system
MNISPKTVDALRKQGWEVIRVSEILPMNASDEEVLEFARREGRFIVTQNLDFSTLLALGGHNQPSLITLRLAMRIRRQSRENFWACFLAWKRCYDRAGQCSDCG